MARTNRHWTVVAAALAAVVAATLIAATFAKSDTSAAAAKGSTPSSAGSSSAAGSASASGSGSSSAPGSSSASGPGSSSAPGSKSASASGSTSTKAKSSPTTKTSGSKRSQPLKFGVDYSDRLTFDSPADLAAALDDAVAVGVGYIRVDFGWEDYQSFSNYPPDFGKFDNVVAAANARGLKIMATIDFPPPWARRTSCADTSACPPADNAVFATFVKQAVSRYAPKGVHLWEVWNEPNITAWAPTPDAADYAQLLIAASGAIRSADSNATVLMGGLAADHPSPGAPFIKPYDFIKAVAAAGGMKAVDGVAYHPYPSGAPGDSASFQAISSSPANIVAAMTESGYPNMQVWITETGLPVWHAQSAASVYAPEEAAQALAATQETAYLNANPHVAAMFWFNEQDVPSDSLPFGLRTADGRRRPAFATFRQAIIDARG